MRPARGFRVRSLEGCCKATPRGMIFTSRIQSRLNLEIQNPAYDIVRPTMWGVLRKKKPPSFFRFRNYQERMALQPRAKILAISKRDTFAKVECAPILKRRLHIDKRLAKSSDFLCVHKKFLACTTARRILNSRPIHGLELCFKS